MDSKHTEAKAVDSLSKKHDIEISRSTNMITEIFGNKAKRDVGKGSRGKIDFLTKYCGYKHQYVNPS